MAVQDDVRRLSQIDSIYLGIQIQNSLASSFTTWFKGRLQQAGDGAWIMRSVSSDGTVSGFQLGFVGPNWQSSEFPNTGITVTIQITQQVSVPNVPPVQLLIGFVYLQQQLAPELTS